MKDDLNKIYAYCNMLKKDKMKKPQFIKYTIEV